MRIEDFPNELLVDRFEQCVQVVVEESSLAAYVAEQRQVARDELLRRLDHWC